MSRILKFVRPVNGVAVEQRRSDGYVNATAMSKAHQAGTGQRRDVSEWLSSERTQESIRHVSLKTGIPVFKLIESKPGRYGGTWIHPKLATRFAIWLSDEFGYEVEHWVEEWLLTARNPVEPLNDVDQEWIEWQQRYDIRVELKDFLRPDLMNAVVRWAIAHGVSPITLCSSVHDSMNERIQGAKAKQIRAMGGLPLGALLRDYLEASPLTIYHSINKLAKVDIEDNGTEPVQAVHNACDRYLGKAYVPKLVPIAENLYSQGRRLRAVRKNKQLSSGIQLHLWGTSQAS